MKSYYLVKRISKTLVLLSVLAIVLSGGIFFIAKNQVGADTNPADILASNKDYFIHYINSTEFYLYSKNIKPSGNVSDTSDALSLISGDNCSKLEASSCYALFSGYPWSNKQIESKDTDWVFLQNVYDQALTNNDEKAAHAIRHAMSNYAKADSRLVLDSNRQVLIYYPNVYAVDISSPALKQSSTPNDGVAYVSNLYCLLLESDHCWEYDESATGIPSVDSPLTPSWAFVSQVNQKTKTLDAKTQTAFQKVYDRYVTHAWDFWEQVDIKHLSSKYVGINSQAFLDALSKNDPGSLNAEDPYWTLGDVNGSSSDKQFVLKLEDAYPEATENSVWLKGMEFVLNSVIPQWTNLGIDLNEQKTLLTKHVENFLSYAKKSQAKGGNSIITLTAPAQIMLDSAASTFKFTVDIDPSKLDKSTTYDVKIFVKPSSKQSAAPAVYIGKMNQSESFSLTWADIVSAGYSNGTTKYVPTAADGNSYDFKWPQKYIIKAVMYNSNDAVADETSADFQSVDASVISDSGSASPFGAYLNLAVDKGTATIGNKVKASVRVKNGTTADTQIKKVVLYACSSDQSQVLASESETCTLMADQNGEVAATDAVKTAWDGITFDSSGLANFTYDWDTSGSTVGAHSLMAKAYKTDGNYLDGSKNAVSVRLTDVNGSVGATSGATSGGGNYGNLWAPAGLASDSPTGSSIRTIGGLATRIVNILLIVIGAMSVIAIIVGGIFYITSGGDQKKAEKGKKTVLYACIGIAIATLTYVIEGAIINIISDLIK